MAKIIAFYLPQFHTFPENDKWWGKGFTEWVNVKKANPLFKGHIQPKEPLDDFYYDLTDARAQEHQISLAKKYSIYGFCYYHYWFNGKLLMEKPLHNMLKNPKVDLPFCLCWANEPWTRAWDGKTSTVLMPQIYLGPDDWEKHFNYLLSYFKDSRYIKINNQPVFVIYRSNNIPHCEEMIDYWDTQCRNNGFNGIHIIEEINAFQSTPVCNNSKSVLAFEPSNIQHRRSKIQKTVDMIYSKYYVKNPVSKCKIYNYDKVWKKILDSNLFFKDKSLFYGGFVNWDNSPRKKEKGIIYVGGSPSKFEKYLRQLIAKSRKADSEYIFLNAWNEWAEGAYLEPDKQNGYAYLEAIRKSTME